MSRINLTREGEIKLHADLKHLKEIERPRVINAIAEARRKGDLSENSEYDAAKEAQHKLETRIHKLEVMVRNVSIIDESKIDNDKVFIGARADLEDVDTGKKLFFIIVNELEANLDEGKISTVSPIGKCLLGKAVGEIAEVNVPNGTIRYKVTKISR
ncbi:transcription elongation factor GreA [Candidatus Latescibacterota bacterium]